MPPTNMVANVPFPVSSRKMKPATGPSQKRLQAVLREIFIGNLT